MESIKNLIHLSLDEVEAELERELVIEDIPEGSIVIFDDVESFPKAIAKKYLELRDIIAERGRHRKVSLITVSHNAMAGNATKVSIRESQYWVLFPKFNARDTKTILKIYGGLDAKDTARVTSMNSRWVLYRKAIPKYAVGQNSVIAMD